MFNSEKLAEQLIAIGIPATGVLPWEHHVDGNIDITDKISIQVGVDYLIINRILKDNKVGFSRSYDTVTQIIADLKMLLA